MEAFDFAVRLGPVRAGAFVDDAGLVERVAPDPRLVAGTVVGQGPFDVYAVVGELRVSRCQSSAAVTPCSSLRISEYANRVRSSSAVWMNRYPTDERRTADAWPRPCALQPPPSGIPESFLTSTWTSSPGRSRSYRRTGSRSVARSPRSRRPSPAARRIDCAVDAAIPTSCAMWSAPHRRRRRSRITSRRVGASVRFGDRCGRDDRSRSPAEPSARNRSRHLRTVFASTWNRCAVASIGQPCSTTQPTIRSRPFGVNTAFGCWLLAWSTSPPE